MNAKKYTLLNFLLALALFASSAAWAPAPAAQQDPDRQPFPAGNPNGEDYSTQPFAKKWPLKYARGRLSARIVGDDLILYGEKLPPEHSFFVKARRNIRSDWERLGVSYSNNRGILDDRYILPQAMRKTFVVHVCLKDVITNKAYCVAARRIGY